MAGAICSFAILTFMIVDNIVVVSHLFAHVPWFKAPILNGLVSALNSINIGQLVQAHRFKHVRNHHRYNNDPKGNDGTTARRKRSAISPQAPRGSWSR